MKLQPSNVPSLWRMWTQRKSSSFLSFPLHFLFHSNSSLLAQSFSSSLIITSHLSSFLPPLSTHTQPVFFLLLSAPLSFQQSATVTFFASLLSSPLLPSTLQCFWAYLWSRCSFPSHSPTQWSPGSSSPAGPRILHMKTPVQVGYMRAYLHQWFINRWLKGTEFLTQHVFCDTLGAPAGYDTVPLRYA